jgi:C4-dicarboxylate transporter DctM subunit
MIIVSLLLVLLALLGAPLFAIIAASAMWGFANTDVDLSVMGIEIFGLAEVPILLAIPLFTFAGYLISESGAPRRLVRISNALLGWLPGGLAMISLAACALFTAFTGASGVTIIALGALLYPALKEAGYKESFNLGLVTSAGSLGLLFAPSLPLILYGVVAEVSIDSLFLGGILPGTLMVVMLAAYSFWVNRHNRAEPGKFSWKEVRDSLWEAKWEVPLPIVVLGGIYGGVFAVSEAAAVTALYVLIIDVLIMREVSLKQLPRIMQESMVLVGGILIILAVSLASTNYMIDSGVPDKLFAMVESMVDTPFGFMVALLIFLLVLGAILDIFSAIVLVVPLILPVAQGFGIDPVHLGIVFLAAMQLGYLTPPVGLNLFIASFRFEKSITSIYMATLPFLLILAVAVVIIAFWPEMTLFFLQD